MSIFSRRLKRGLFFFSIGILLFGAAETASANSALDVLDTRPGATVAKAGEGQVGSEGLKVLPSEKVKNKSPYFSKPGYAALPGYKIKSKAKKYITAHNIRLSEALGILGSKDGVTYYIVGSDISLPDSSYRIYTFKDLEKYLKKTTPYTIKRERGRFKKGDLVRVLVYRKGFLAKHKLSLFGESSLYRALGVLGGENINVIFDSNLPNKKIHLGISTRNLDKYVMSVCDAADVWCDFSKQNLRVSKTKQFIVSAPINGLVEFNSQNGAGGGGEDEGGQGKQLTKTFSYKISGIDYKQIPKIISENFPNIKFSYSASGFYTFTATPSQYRRIMRYFEEEKQRKQVIYAEIQLIRIDLNDQFKWGVNWTEIASWAMAGKTWGAGLLAPNFAPNDPNGWVGVLDPKRESIVNSIINKKVSDGTLTSDEYNSLSSQKYNGLIQFFGEFGDVHFVESWFNQMVTGVPLPFSNYQLVRYFSVGSVDNGNGGAETTVEIRQDEVGFKGVITVNKNNDGYLVEGYVDQSYVDGYIELVTDQGTLKAPNITGKSVRIQTKLTHLGNTIIVGGFRGKGIEKSEGGVPILKDIPILGYLFKNKKDLTKNSEFVILITLREAKEGTLGGEKE